MKVRIIRIPDGEAPEYIRAAWIGMEFPSVSRNAREYRSVGVLTGPRSRLGEIMSLFMRKGKQTSGYAVPSMLAIALLAQRDANAARWWRENAPHMLNPRKFFVFNAECCEEIQSDG